MAKLLFDSILQRFIWKGSFVERELARDAGFLWDVDRLYWYTYKVAEAYKLRKYTEPHLAAIIEANYHKEAQTIKASGALDAKISIPLPPGRSLRPFQRAGVKYLLATEDTPHKGAFLTDEMGLGKTVQAIAAMNAIPDLHNILIIATKSLLLNWMREYKRWSTHKLDVGIADGDFVPNTDVVIINYDILSRNREALSKRQWDVMICDECHLIKNGEAARTKAIFGGKAVRANKKKKKKAIPAIPPLQVTRAYMLTGTPLEGKPVELWPVIHYLAPTIFRSYWSYVKRYCGAYRGSWGWVVDGAAHLEELQRKLRGSVMVRREKADVLTELPPKTHQLIELPPSADGLAAMTEEQKLCKEMQQEAERIMLKDLPYREAVHRLKALVYAAFDEISALRKETALAKVPEAVDFILQALTPGHKMVVFAHHHGVVDQVNAALLGKGVETVVVTGKTNAKQRDTAVSSFQNNPNVQVFLGNIRAAGVGLTLTAASHVVFIELDWTPGAMNQAEDRCHRIGQLDHVLVQVLVLEDSLDARMAKKLIAKQDITDNTLSGLPELQAVFGADITNSLETLKQKEKSMFEKLMDLLTRLVVAIETIAAAVNGGVELPASGGTSAPTGGSDPEPEPELSTKELIAKAKWDPRTDKCPTKVVGTKRTILEALLNEMGVEFAVSATGNDLYNLLHDNLKSDAAEETDSGDDDLDGFDDLFDEEPENAPEEIKPEEFRARIKAFHQAAKENKAKIGKAFKEIDGGDKLSAISPENFAAILEKLGA